MSIEIQVEFDSSNGFVASHSQSIGGNRKFINPTVGSTYPVENFSKSLTGSATLPDGSVLDVSIQLRKSELSPTPDIGDYLANGYRITVEKL